MQFCNFIKRNAYRWLPCLGRKNMLELITLLVFVVLACAVLKVFLLIFKE